MYQFVVFVTMHEMHVGETGAHSPHFWVYCTIIAARLRKLEASILVGLLGYSSAYILQCYNHR